ncbi:MAG: hypothetical protein WCE62_18955 [Polyangiales bacterium]
MEELLKERLGEIALLIYILYPLLKRWWDRRRSKKEPTGEAPQPSPAAPERARPSPPAVEPTRAPQAMSTSEDAKRTTEADLLAAASAQLEELKHQASQQLARAESDPRLLRLAPALRDDLLDRLDMIERSLRNHPNPSTIIQGTDALRDLEALLRRLKTMAQRRIHRGSNLLGAADEMADACYAPLLEFAATQGLELSTSQPLVVPGDWEPSIIPRFASTRVAPIRLPMGFEDSLWHWPEIAHAVSHDFFYSLHDLDRQLRDRLGLPERVELPRSSPELDGSWLRRLFGAWLPEIVADAISTLLLGPAYVEAMARTLRNPASAQRTAAIFQTNGQIDPHPPARLRLYMATRVLHHLGRHREAERLWEQWEGEHSEVRFYYLPLGGQWVGLSDDAVHSIADSLIDVLLQQGWPELDGFQLLNVPGLPYLHAEHANVQRIVDSLSRGQAVKGNARWIMAAAVLAAAAQPTLHDQILETARRSIVGLGTAQAPIDRAEAKPRRYRSIGGALIGSLGEPHALDEAIALAAAFTPYKAPNWHSR